MNLFNPIEINIKSFFLEGKFDYVKLGENKEWLQKNFSDPDGNDWEVGRKNSILKYGDIEFHFEKDILYLIYSDSLDNFSGGESLLLDKWFLDFESNKSWRFITDLFYNEKVDFIVTHIDEENSKIKILKSGIELYFLNKELNAFAWHLYKKI